MSKEITSVRTLCHELMSQMEDFKHKISDGEYKKIVDLLVKHHGTDERDICHEYTISRLHVFHMMIASFHQKNTIGVEILKLGALEKAIFNIYSDMCYTYPDRGPRSDWLEKSPESRADCILEHLLKSNTYEGCNLDCVVCENNEELGKLYLGYHALTGLSLSEMEKVINFIKSDLAC